MATNMTALLDGPAAAPPAGVVSQLDNPPSEWEASHVFPAFSIALVTILVAMRLYTTIFVTRRAGFPDREFENPGSVFGTIVFYFSYVFASITWRGMGLLRCLCNYVHPRCECCTWRAHVERSLEGYGALPLRKSACFLTHKTCGFSQSHFHSSSYLGANIENFCITVATNGCNSLRANHLLAQVVDLGTIHASVHADPTALLPLLGYDCRHGHQCLVLHCNGMHADLELLPYAQSLGSLRGRGSLSR